MALTDEAILQIKEMIRSGRLKPGDRLPSERELSASLGLSCSSLREAVKAPEIMRVLDVRRGDGTYVTSLQPHLLLESVAFAVEIHQDTSILDVFAVRRILEPAAAVLATARATDEDMHRLRAVLAEVDTDTSVDHLVAHDMEFHRSLSASSGDSYLVSLIDSLSSRTLRARVWRGLTEDRAVERTLAGHGAIVDAVAAGDATLVRARTLVHLSGVRGLAPSRAGLTGGTRAVVLRGTWATAPRSLTGRERPGSPRRRCCSGRTRRTRCRWSPGAPRPRSPPRRR